jgi:hypothetical protein
MRPITPDPQRRYRQALAAVFVLWLVVPLVWQATRLVTYWRGGSSDHSIRIVAGDLLALDRWFVRSFPQRGQLYGIYNTIRHHLFGQLPVAVVEGNEGWLFYRSEAMGEPGLDDFVGQIVPTAGEIARWRATIAARRARLGQRAIAYVVAIAPNKHTIYPDRLPLALRSHQGISRLDRVVAAFAGEVDGFLDLRPALLAARAREPVYHRTDTHWNDAGAYAAYRAIVAAFAADRPGLAPLARTCFRTERTRYGGDIGRMMQMALDEEIERWSQAVPPPEGCPAPGQAGRPTIVIIGDSFVEPLVPFLGAQFEILGGARVFSSALVDRLRPQLVLQEIVERALPNLLDDRPDVAPAP